MKKALGWLRSIKGLGRASPGHTISPQRTEPTSKPPGKAKGRGLWRKSWRAFWEGLVYLLPWLIIPSAILIIIACFYLVETLSGPSRNACVIWIGRVNEVVSQPVLLAGLLAALVGFGVRLWEHQKGEERREKERIMGEVEGVGRLLREQRWDEALRAYRDFSQRRDRAWGEQEVQDRLREIWERESPEPLCAYADCLRQCPRPDAPPSGWWENVGGVGKAVKALFWASQNLGREEYDRATRVMVSLLSSPKIAPQAAGTLQRMEKVERWLWDSRFEKPLEDFREESWAGPLRNLRAGPRPRPSLWRSPRPADRKEVQQILRFWRLTGNPFGPEAAEMEAELPRIGYEPSSWETLSRWKPTLAVGASGSGKSAAALLLAHRWLERPTDPFPVYASLSLPEPATAEAVVASLSRLLAGALVEYLALDPDAFLAAELPGRAGMAALLLHFLGTKDRLASHFSRAGLACSTGVGSALLGEMAELASSCPESRDLLSLLGQARPARREVTVFLLEPRVEGRPREFAGRLQVLLDLAAPLARFGVFLKVFLPDTVRPLRWEGDTFRLRWSEDDLLGMLEKRLRLSGHAEGTLNALASRDIREKIPDLDRWMVRRAEGFPRELVRLGNRLLEIVAGHPEDPRILPDDLERLKMDR